MKYLLLILVVSLTNNLISQSNFDYEIPQPPDRKYSFLYEIPSAPDIQDSSLKKIEYYELIENRGSIPVKKVYYKKGRVSRTILYKRNTDSIKAIFDYEYVKKTRTHIKYKVLDNNDTIYVFRTVFISSYNKPYYVIEFDSTNSKMLAIQFINSEFDSINNLVKQDAILLGILLAFQLKVKLSGIIGLKLLSLE